MGELPDLVRRASRATPPLAGGGVHLDAPRVAWRWPSPPGGAVRDRRRLPAPDAGAAGRARPRQSGGRPPLMVVAPPPEPVAHRRARPRRGLRRPGRPGRARPPWSLEGPGRPGLAARHGRGRHLPVPRPDAPPSSRSASPTPAEADGRLLLRRRRPALGYPSAGGPGGRGAPVDLALSGGRRLGSSSRGRPPLLVRRRDRRRAAPPGGRSTASRARRSCSPTWSSTARSGRWSSARRPAP